MFRKLRRAVSLIMLLISIALIIWAGLPAKRQRVVQSIPSAEMAISQPGQGSDPQGMPSRQVILEWPESMRIGEEGAIKLIFEPVEMNSTLSRQATAYPDVYTSYNLMAEARYDVAGISLAPANPTRESLPSGQPVKFTWKVNADKVGSYDGTVWLSLRFLPLDGSQASQAPIYVREINIRTSSFFGLNESIAYLLGGLGVVIAGALVYDDLITWVRRRTRKKIIKYTTVTKELTENNK